MSMIFYLCAIVLIAVILIFLSVAPAIIPVLAVAIVIVIFLFFVFILLALEAYRVVIKNNAPYVRSDRRLLEKVIESIPVAEGAAIYELGCGDARFLRMLAKKGTFRLVGYEYSLIPFVLGKILNFLYNSGIDLRRKDFFTADLSDADYLFTFLMPDEQARLEEKLKKELHSGATVFSNTFIFQDWEPVDTLRIGSSKHSLNKKIYIYKK